MVGKIISSLWKEEIDQVTLSRRYDILHAADQENVQKWVKIKQNQFTMQLVKLTKWLKLEQQEIYFCIQ